MLIMVQRVFVMVVVAMTSHLVVFAADPGPAGISYVLPNKADGTSSAVIVGPNHLAHTAQLLPVDRQGHIVGVGDPTTQVQRVFDNLSSALAEVRSGLDRVVKINMAVADAQIVPEIRKAMAERFDGDVRPAFSLVVGRLAHADALVAMDAVAGTDIDIPGEQVKRASCPSLDSLPGSSQAAVLPAGPRVYVSGQAEQGENLGEATRHTMESLRKTIAHLGLTDRHIVQLKAFLRPMSGVAEVEREVAKQFGNQAVPPLVFVEWNGPYPIEIELIASARPIEDKAGEAIEFITPPDMSPSPVFSRVCKINCGNVVYLSGLYGATSEDSKKQVEEIFETLSQSLAKVGSDFRHLAKATYFVTDDEAAHNLDALRPRYYDPHRPPAASKALVNGVGPKGKAVMMDMIAVVPLEQ